ncbi:MAG: efflux transporter outer membrane subunit [Verrucomicrobia bacterium]|nr:efflux transporter outer membrane subunit [Verrucomicrobiota bacterium]
MRSNHLKSIFVFLLLLGSCARVPDGDLAHLSDPISLDSSRETALAREFFEEGGWPSERWWEMFEDPQLDALIEQALKESPTIQQALAKVAAAEAEARKERSALFPTLSADYEEQWQYFSKNGFVRSFYPTAPPVVVPATANQLDLTLNFNYEIDFFGRNRNLFKAALGKARAERAEAKQATLIVTTLIAQTYIELQTKLAQKEVLRDRLDQRNMLFELTTSRGANGLDPALPLLEREQSIYEVEQSLIQLEKEITLDRHMLCVLVGIGPDSDIVPKPLSVIFERPVSIPTDLSSDLLARRPDLTAQIWRVEAAAKEIGAAKADFYPRVNLMAFGGLESLSFNKLLNFGSKEGGLVPAVHLPIFTGGRLTANLKNKVALFNEETYRYNDLLLTAAREVADQIAILSATFDTLNCQINSLETAEDQLELQFSRYKQGINDFLSVLEREDNLFTQRYQLYGYERDYLLAVLKMIKAIGGGYRADQRLPYQGG